MIRNRIVVLILVISMLIMTLPPLATELPVVQGTVTKLGNGDLIVDGSTHTIDMDGPYQHEGNITVKGASGKLIIRDTVFKILTPNYQRNIYVKDGGQLILENSTITVDLDSFNFTEDLNIEVTNNGVLDMDESSLKCDGLLKGNNGKIYVRNSEISKNENPGGLNDNCVDIMLSGASYMLLSDSSIKELAKFSYIDVGGSSEFIVINSFIDIDFRDNEWSRLRVKDTATAYLYGVTTVEPVSYPPDASAITVTSTTARAEIYKWAELTVVDSAGIPVGGASATARNFTLAKPVDTPRSEILTYIGKTTMTWNVSGVDGLVKFPLKTNVLKYGTPNPVNNYTGTYNLTARLASFTPKATGGASFTSYPRMLMSENTITKNVTFEGAVVPPDKNKHYSTRSPLMIKGETVFKSPVQIQQNIIVDGGVLTLDSAEMKFDQSAKHRFYIVVKNDGKLIIENSELYDKSDIKYNIYNYGSTVNISDSNLDDLGVLVTRDGGQLNLVSAVLNGNFHSRAANAEISMIGDTRINGKMAVMDYANVMMEDTTINVTDSISLDEVDIIAVNTSFSKRLTFNGNTMAELINVKILVSPNPIVVEDNAVVYRGWWLTTNVTDAGHNPVEGAVVDVYNYSLPSGDLLMYSNGTTDAKGQVVMKVIGEVMTATDVITGLERSYYLEANYKSYKSSTSGFTAPTMNLLKELVFTQKPDLTPTSIVVKGEQTEGKMLNFNITVKNQGDFEARDVAVRILINDKPISQDIIIGYLSNGESTYIQLAWEAKLGNYVFKVAVDPDNKIGEDYETNNNKTMNLAISTGAPDVYIYPENIIFNPAKGTKEQVVNITVKVGNMGDTDPRSFDNPVYVDLYIGDPDSGGVKIKNTTVLNSIKPFEFANAYFEHIFVDVGTYDIYARISTDLDSDPLNNNAFKRFTIQDFADLTIKPADIKFKPSDKVAKDADVTIEVTVANIGESSASNVQVDFYEGDPAGSGAKHLGTKTAAIVEGKGGLGAAVVTLVQAFDVQGVHNIFVVIDAPNNTRELNEKNNKANNTLRVLKGPDLLIKEDYIMVHSSMTGHIIHDETVTITAQVDNIGETASGPFNVNFYYKNDLNLIGTESFEDLQPGEDVSAQVTWVPAEAGTHKIIARAVPTTPIIEMDVENNANSSWFKIFSKPDLTMDLEDLFSDINVIPPSVPYSKDVKLTATVRNRGESDAGAFWVQFFDGNPATGGTQIGLNKRINGLVSGSTASVEVTWSAIPGGQHTIYVKVDPFNEVVEANEANNSRTLIIYVETVPDLVVTAKDIVFLEGDFGRIGTPLTINVTIKNAGDIDSDAFTVKFYDGDKVHDKTFTLIKSLDHSGIKGGESDTMEITWAPESFGNHKVFVWIDEEEEIFELNDENNYAFKIFEVLELAPDLMFDEKTDVKVLEQNVQATKYKTTITYQFNVTIHNVGNEAVSEFYVTIDWEDPVGAKGKLGGKDIMMAGIESGSRAYIELDWTPAKVGTYKFNIMVDSTGLYREFNEENNTNSEPITFNVVQIPDLFIGNVNMDITVLPLDARAGDTLTISVEVTATGDLDVAQVTMSLTVDGVLVDTQTQPLSAETPMTASFTMTYKHEYEGIPKFVFKLDPDNTIKELNEGNNEVAWENLYLGAAEEEEEAGVLSGMMLWLIIIVVIVVVVIIVLFFFMKKLKRKKAIECEECGTLVKPGVTECPECGAAIVVPPEIVECTKCGAEITVEDPTCPECGEANASYVPPTAGLEDITVPPEDLATAAAPAPAPAPAPKPKKEKKKKAAAGRPGPATAPAAPAPAPMPAPGMGETEMEELEGLDDVLTEEGEGEAECYKCGARVPLSVPKCPVCGADFE